MHPHNYVAPANYVAPVKPCCKVHFDFACCKVDFKDACCECDFGFIWCAKKAAVASSKPARASAG